MGNLGGATEPIQHPGRIAGSDGFSPSPVIPATANEFPSFSFLLADLHAHVLASPYFLVGIAYAMQLAIYGPGRWSKRSGWALVSAELALAGLVLGVLYAANAADFPTAI